MVKERKEIEKQYQWNVNSLYPSLEEWEKDYLKLIQDPKDPPCFSKILKRKNRLHQGPKQLALLLHDTFELERYINKLYTYAHLRHDEDITHEKHKSAYKRITLFYYDYKNATSWIEPEILQLDIKLFESYLESKELKVYRIYLKKLFLLRSHILSFKEEALLSLASKALDAPRNTFSILNDADLKFPEIEDQTGQKKELTYGSFSLYLYSKDRTLRKNAFIYLHREYKAFENTLSELIYGHVQKHFFHTKVRNYSSCLSAALMPHQISVQVYENLIQVTRENLASLHRYIKLRKALLGVKELRYYDLHVSLVSAFEKKYNPEEAKNLVVQSVAVLGEEFQKILEKGLKEERWVDMFENARKRSGAYSSGCYDSFPFILMNYQGTLRDVMTLSHEAGHSMHSYFSNKHQPYHYSHYPIFLAEIASTFNEDLLFRFLMEKATSREERCYLLNQKIDDIRATFFRQTQFAEFELKIHSLVEQGKPLTPTILKDIYLELCRDYYGEDLESDPEIAVECLRIPHFYSNFYVYQYATGISAAFAFVKKVLDNPKKGREDYLHFLSSGSSRFSLDLLKDVGIDMESKVPFQTLIHRFDQLVSELESEMKC